MPKPIEPPERIYNWQKTSLVRSISPPIIVHNVEYVIAWREEGHPLLRRDVMVAEAKKALRKKA